MMNFATIILAAGQGTRMKSVLPKPLHRLGGKPLLGWVLDTAHAAGTSKQTVIIPNDNREVSDFIAAQSESIQTAIQHPPKGTGDAVLQARDVLADFGGIVLVAFADTPLVYADTYRALVDALAQNPKAAIACLGFHTDKPTGYGRMLVDDDGNLLKIIEEDVVTDAERSINFVNAGIMALRAPQVFEILRTISTASDSGEIYLTDCIAAAQEAGHQILTLTAHQDEVMGINSRTHLAEAEAILQQRLRRAAMDSGVTLIAPETVFLHYDTILGQDVIIEPHTVFGANVAIGAGSEIKSFSHIEDTVTGPCCVIGPYARLRGGTELGEGVKIGNFVETKNTKLGDLAKASHLTYLGDSTVGTQANIGAGVITCNYDGVNKHQTTIGDEAFIGSNTALVAPISVGDRAMIGAGSTITSDIDDDALALTRPEMKAVAGGASKLKKRQKKS